MSWFFSVALPADPAGCHDAAATLRSAAGAAQHAADFLDGQAALPTVDFSGVAAQSYRSAARALGSDTRGVASDLQGLATALEDYTHRVGAARRALQRVREAATAAGFRLTADDLVQWVPGDSTDQATLYQRLEARATRAHAEAEAARAEWWGAVRELTTGPLATPSSEPLSEPSSEPRVELPTVPVERPADLGPAAPVSTTSSAESSDETAPASYEPKPERRHPPFHAAVENPDLAALHWAPPPLHWAPLPEPAPSCPAAEGVLE